MEPLNIISEVVDAWTADRKSITLGRQSGIQHIKKSSRFPITTYYTLKNNGVPYAKVRAGYSDKTETLGVLFGDTVVGGIIMQSNPDMHSWTGACCDSLQFMAKRVKFASILRTLIIEKEITMAPAVV